MGDLEEPLAGSSPKDTKKKGILKRGNSNDQGSFIDSLKNVFTKKNDKQKKNGK